MTGLEMLVAVTCVVCLLTALASWVPPRANLGGTVSLIPTSEPVILFTASQLATRDRELRREGANEERTRREFSDRFDLNPTNEAPE